MFLIFITIAVLMCPLFAWLKFDKKVESLILFLFNFVIAVVFYVPLAIQFYQLEDHLNNVNEPAVVVTGAILFLLPILLIIMNLLFLVMMKLLSWIYGKLK